MQEIAIVYFVVAWLVCWLIDLVMVVARGPILIDPILKFIVVLLCVIVLLYRLANAHWLW